MAYPTQNCNADVQLLGRNLQPRIQTYATQMLKSTTHIPESTQPFVVDTFKNCEGLGRLAVFEGNSVNLY